MSSSKHLSFDPETNQLTVDYVEGLEYLIGSKVVSGQTIQLTKNTTVRVRPRGKVLPKDAPKEFKFEVSPLVEELDDDALEALTNPDPVDPPVDNSNPEGQDPEGSFFDGN